MQADEGPRAGGPHAPAAKLGVAGDGQAFESAPGKAQAEQLQRVQEGVHGPFRPGAQGEGEEPAGAAVVARPKLVAGAACQARMVERSEEHTSELQSLMRISYAV